MSLRAARDAFFVGWSQSIDPALGRFLGLVGLMVLCVLGLAGLGQGLSLNDPAESLLKLGERQSSGAPVSPEPWIGGQAFTGTILDLGFPVLHVGSDAAHPQGRMLLLSGDGKIGPSLPTATGAVAAKGGLIRRGMLEMLLVEGAIEPAGDAVSAPAAPRPVPLGRWRIVGEICDGKCYAGAMQPGLGLAHRVCANLCLTGELPAIFASLSPVGGSSTLLLSLPDGQRPPAALLAGLTAVPVELTGDVERIGNILRFKADLAKARRL